MSATILLTGATSDLSIEYLYSIKNQSKTVIAFFRNHQERLNVFEKSNLTIVPVCCDLANSSEVYQKIRAIDRQYQIDAIIHFASPTVKNERFHKIETEYFDTHFKVQVLSIIEILKVVLPSMKKRKSGRIIFMLSSVTLGNPPKMWSDYVTAKYALLGLMKSLIVEYGSSNIQFNAVSPSMFKSKFLSEIDELMIEMYEKNHPMKSLLEKQEIISLLSFLVENNNSFITGNNFNLSGGEDIV